MRIPIRNVYYLFCYAWNRYEEGQSVDLGEVEPSRLQDLLGHVLTAAVSRIIRRGLHRDYVAERDDVRGVRGKIVMSGTVKRLLLVSGGTHCEYDELQYDVPHNQIIKSTLGMLLALDDLDRDVRQGVRQLRSRLAAVREVRISPELFRSVRIDRNNQQYGFVLAVCRLLYECLFVDKRTGDVRFKDPRRDAFKMWQLFQDFVLNFYRREQPTFSVSAPIIHWRGARASEHDLRYLPDMLTDVVLRGRDRTIIIDTKFYRDPLHSRFGRKRLRSEHVYQLFSYLENWEAATSAAVEGILLYPCVQESFCFEYVLNGHRLRAATLDLAQPWQQIHNDMLALLS